MNTWNLNLEIDSIMNEKEDQHEAGDKQLRILVVDDHPLVHRELVRHINEVPCFTVCAEAECTKRSLEILEKQQVDLAIVNISLDSIDSIRLADEVRLRFPGLSVLTFSISIYDELLYVKRVLQKAGEGYVVNQGTTEQIMAAIKLAHSLLRNGVSGANIHVEVKRSESNDHKSN